jgi:hypothetical protein
VKLNKIRPLTISVFLTFYCTTTIAQNVSSILHIFVADDQGSATYDMVYGNHINATWGMGGEKDSLDPAYIEKESPPLPPGLGVVWRPSRSGVSWGIGFLKFDIKGWTNAAQVDTFRLYFANASATDADITLSWADAATLSAYCTAMTIRVGSDYYDMFTQTSLVIADAGDNGVSQAYIYKIGAILNRIKLEKTVIPEEFILYHNYPNPFNPTTTITFDILRTSDVEVAIYNIIGQKVTTLVSQELTPGTYSTVWDARNSMNVTVNSGVYYVRMIARYRGIEQYSAINKILFVK